MRTIRSLVTLSCSAALALCAPAAALATSTGGAAYGGGTTAASTTAAPATGDGSATGVSQTQAVKLTRSQTKSVQRRIGVTADGAFGAHSRAAMKRFQKRRHLTVTGRPDLETLKAMKLKFAASIERRLAAAGTGDAAPTQTLSTPGVSAAASAAIGAARAQIGTPYRYGGEKPGGFDCSGLVMWSYARAGVDLPRTSFDQFEEGTAVKRADIRPGDLVFFDTAGSGASHVGIAVSATEAISSTSHGVMQHEIFDDYWGSHYVGARRVA